MAYLYRHIRLDKNVPFYIGIGTDKYFKRAKNKTKRNPIWKRIVSKTDYEIEILFNDISLEFAKEKEREFIAMYGRIDNGDGTLANLSAGGDGMFNVSKGVRKRLSELNSGEKNHFYGKRHSEETKKRLSEVRKGVKTVPCSDDKKAKLSLAHKGRPSLNKGKKDPKGAAKRTGINHTTYRGKVYCYNSDATLYKVFLCPLDAAKEFGVGTNAIRRVIIGERNHCKGYVFKYENEPPNPIKPLDVTPKKVIDPITGMVYDTTREAAKAFGLHEKTLAHWLKGDRRAKTHLKYMK